jgi:hypothetical protein
VRTLVRASLGERDREIPCAHLSCLRIYSCLHIQEGGSEAKEKFALLVRNKVR